MRITQEKRLALANCNGLLVRACDELDRLMGQGTSRGLRVQDVERLAPAAQRVIELRRRRRRLEAELHAVTSEWATD